MDLIPNEIKNRESRFKFVINVEGIQSVNEVELIVKSLLKGISTDEDIKQYSTELSGKTLDEIKQFCFDKIMSIPSHKNHKSKLVF